LVGCEANNATLWRLSNMTANKQGKCHMAELIDNTARNRYEMTVNDATAFITYDRTADTVVLVHTEVPPEMSGQGIGSKLAQAALDDVRRHGQKVVPHCTFIQKYLQRHPEYDDIILPAE
jgi:uncharacterized protein